MADRLVEVVTSWMEVLMNLLGNMNACWKTPRWMSGESLVSKPRKPRHPPGYHTGSAEPDF